MNILIIGCGKVGSGLANSLYKKGHDVSVIDARQDNFSRLDNNFSGYVIRGVPIDLDVLREGGIEECDFVAAVTDDDNTNIMVSQLAKTFFNVPKVLTRIYDPKRKNIYTEFGLHTISPTALTVDIIERIINGQENEKNNTISFATSSIAIDHIPVPKSYCGVELADVSHDETETIIGIEKADGAIIMRDANENYKLQHGDNLIYAKLI